MSQGPGSEVTLDATSSVDDFVGQEFDSRYLVKRVIGMGAVGVVFEALDERLGCEVALKLLVRPDEASPLTIKRFQREAKALAGLRHPNIVSITDFAMSDHGPYLVMELLEGHTLATQLERGRLAPDEVGRILRGVLTGLSHAHGRGILHRDLKPDNVFLQNPSEGPPHVKLLDFGLAKQVGGPAPSQDPTLTRSGAIMGTPSYMAPEQAAGDRVDASADVYAVGCMLYEMLVGEPPFVGPDAVAVIRQQLSADVPSPTDACPGLELSPQLLSVLERSLVKDQKQRFESATEMLHAAEEMPPPIALLSPELASQVVDTGRVSFAGTLTEGEGPLQSMVRAKRGFNFWRLATFGLLALCVVGAISAVALWPEEEPAAPHPVSAPMTDFDAWAAEAATEDGLTDVSHRAIAAAQRLHRDDARYSLLLAHDFMKKGWRRDSLRRYRQAHGMDPNSVMGPIYLRDLLLIAAHPETDQLALRFVRSLKGPELTAAYESLRAEEGLRVKTRKNVRKLRRRLE